MLAFSSIRFQGPTRRLTLRVMVEKGVLWNSDGHPGGSARGGRTLRVPSSRQGHSLKAALSLVLSDIIRYFNPSVLTPLCVPGKRAVPHSGVE